MNSAIVFHQTGGPEVLQFEETVLGEPGPGEACVRIGRRYPLREAAQAHRDLEARRTTGSTILIP